MVWIQSDALAGVRYSFPIPARQKQRVSEEVISLQGERIQSQCPPDFADSFVEPAERNQQKGAELKMSHSVVRIQLKGAAE